MKAFFEAEIRQRLDAEEKHRKGLFPQGYLFTEKRLGDLQGYPFYGHWQEHSAGRYYIYARNELGCCVMVKNGVTAAMVGYAFDPFTDKLSESEILEDCLDAYEHGEDDFFAVMNRITGKHVVFLVHGDSILAVQDCAGMRMLYFGLVDNEVWMTGTPQIVSDLCALQRDPRVIRLLNSKGYYRGSRYLPGNMSPYRELTRLGANTCVEYKSDFGFSIRRFFPVRPRAELMENDKAAAVEAIYSVFRKNIEMILRKWPDVALSLTGGVDSQTSLACANGWYDRLYVYSFDSKPSEKADAQAAARICEELGIPHHYYAIPEDPADLDDYDFLVKLLDHNTSYLMRLNLNELRKYVFFYYHQDFSVELKSESSELGRAIMGKKFYVKLPEVLSPRHLSIFQARYFLEPSLLHMADDRNAEFMRQTGLEGPIFNFEHINLFFWEVRIASWGSTSIASQEFCHEMVSPFNNRRLIEMFYAFPLEDRANDRVHRMLTMRGNPKLAALDIHVKDGYFDKKRVMLETLYYLYATRLNTFGKKRSDAGRDSSAL